MNERFADYAGIVAAYLIHVASYLAIGIVVGRAL